MFNTEISPDDPIYEALGELEEGEKVIFSGIFEIHNDAITSGYFLNTTNMTEAGALLDPTFTFILTSIETLK